jgi:hypothetical protein
MPAADAPAPCFCTARWDNRESRLVSLAWQLVCLVRSDGEIAMISFSCSHCAMKIKVKPEFAGRSARCPTCKQALTVPLPERAVAHVPVGQIDGTASSLAQAGVDGGVTVGQEATSPGQKSVGELLARQAKKGQRYIIEKEIVHQNIAAVLRH